MNIVNIVYNMILLGSLVILCLSFLRIRTLYKSLREQEKKGQEHYNEVNKVYMDALRVQYSNLEYWILNKEKWYDGGPEHAKILENYKQSTDQIYQVLVKLELANIQLEMLDIPVKKK